MVRIFEYAQSLLVDEEMQEYSCPHCCKSIEWRAKNKSPMICSGCKQELIDISALIEKWTARRGYHIDGPLAHEIRIFNDIYSEIYGPGMMMC